ncbi:MAG: MAPEG family protein [Rhizobiaceae bacterium]
MQATPLPVTLTFISICAAALLPFTAWIGLYRGRIGVLRGDGGNPALFKRIRIHGNFVENAPLVALAMAGAELLGLDAFWLWTGLGAFFAGRVLHYVLYDNTFRGIALLFTTLPAFAWGAWMLWRLWW